MNSVKNNKNNTNLEQKNKKNLNNGMSLIEILVVVSIFAVLGIITTSAVILTLRGSKKSEANVAVRENISFAMGIIERQIRNSDSIVDCPFDTATSMSYLDEYGTTSEFSCVLDGTDKYIASSSARITNTDIEVVGCNFSCVQENLGNPPVINFSVQARKANATDAEGSTIDVSTKIQLRNY